MTSTERRRQNRRYRHFKFKVIVIALIITFGTLIVGNLNEIMMMQTDTLNTIQEVNQAEKIDVSEDLTPSGIFTITHYCGCSKCTGDGDGITATGTKATEGRTIAVTKDSIIPMGGTVIIDGEKYIAEDLMAGSGNKVDIYCNSHSEAISRGKITREVMF